MTTENTDAAVRILTKTIRKLTAQLAEADWSIRYEEGKRYKAEDRLAVIRKTLDPQPKGLNGLVDRFTQTLSQVVSGDYPTTEDLAAKRMAELAKLRAELDEERKASHSTALSVAAGLNERLQSCVDDALAALEGAGSAVARVHAARRILRGEA